jgi:hypothetical protein
MTAQFKKTSTHPLAKAIGDEIGTVISLGDKEVNIQFPIYGAEFSLGIENFDIKEGDAPLDIRPRVEPTPAELTQNDLKHIGKLYNGFQVPLDEEAQIAVTSIAVMYLTGLFVSTVISFSNGVKMPISASEFMDFAKWFGTERGAFFQ